jgi:hypothetical protein
MMITKMEEISHALAEIINLRNAADCHKRDCNDSQCSVSLWQLKQTALRLQSQVLFGEMTEVKNLIDGWPT